jgi:putative ABC transport system permease protein
VSVVRQVVAVSKLGARSIPRRLASSLVIIVAMAGVAGVLSAVLALSRGLAQTLTITGRADRAIVLQGGANAEEASILPRDAIAKILSAPGIARDANGEPIYSTEALVPLTVPRRSSKAPGSVTLRGISNGAWLLRPEVRIVQGRRFRPGLHELVVGSAAQASFGTLEIGQHVQVQNADWTIVGTFDAGGSAHDSELFCDTETLLGAYRRTNFNAVTVRLTSPDAFGGFRAALVSDPAVSLAVGPEWYYYEAHSRVFAKFLATVATVVGGIMALGAIFAAMNTMYAAVAMRTVEIATLRALGFGAGAVVGSVLFEALLLALIGALVGAALAWLLIGGREISTVSGAGIGNVIFRLHVGVGLVAAAVIWACLVGLLGGLLPALRAARTPVDRALQAV